MKVAVIGCGTIANSAHIPSYMNNPKVEIKYFCDILPHKAQAAVEKYGCGTAITDYHVALNDPEIAAVSVCTPNNMHATIAIDAMRAGKDVLSEKPAARTYKEAEEMLKIIFDTRCFPLATMKDFGGVAGKFAYAVRKATGGYSSLVGKFRRMAEGEIQETLDAIDKLK